MSDLDDRASYSEVSALPAWVLVDAEDRIVASVRAPTAIRARDIFRENGQTGARVRRAEVAPTVPSSGPRCEICSEPINPDRDYRLVTGWERISRAQGGTNAIRAPNRSAERYACMFCVEKLAAGVSPHQQAFALR